MQVVERTATRLTLVSRPWGASLMTMGWLLFWVWALFPKPSPLTATQAVLCILAILAFARVLYHQGQLTCLTLDKTRNEAHLYRRTLLGEIDRRLPLHDLIGLRAQKVFHASGIWGYALRLDPFDPPDGRAHFPNVNLPRHKARALAAEVNAWLDSHQAAA